jgi:hypothetical protein
MNRKPTTAKPVTYLSIHQWAELSARARGTRAGRATQCAFNDALRRYLADRFQVQSLYALPFYHKAWRLEAKLQTRWLAILRKL